MQKSSESQLFIDFQFELEYKKVGIRKLKLSSIQSSAINMPIYTSVSFWKRNWRQMIKDYDNQWGLSFFLADLDLIGIFAVSNFIILIVLLVLAILVLLPFAFISAAKEEERTRPLKEKAMSEIASKFGKVVFVSVDTMRFELNQTIFEAKFKVQMVDGSVEQTVFSVEFNLPNLQEKFFIQHRSVFSKYSHDCQPISFSATPKDFIFHSLNTQYLLTLLEKEKILAELNKYPSNWFDLFRIAFENGVFSLTWVRSGKGTRKKSKSLQQICQTAVIFYDELSER